MCALIQVMSTLALLFASLFRLIIVGFTKDEVIVLLRACSSACESVNILIYFTLVFALRKRLCNDFS